MVKGVKIMKVKKLGWSKSGFGLYEETTNKQFSIINPVPRDNKNYFLAKERFILKGDNELGKFDTLEQAQEACQKHFEQFILSQIEVKAFDPTLLGFIESDPNKLYKLATKIYCLGDFDLLPIKGKWFLNHPKKGWLFRGLDIPDHDFGVKLISQFLGVE